MDHQNATPGYPFGDYYSETYDCRSPELQQILQRQLDELRSFRTGCRMAELLGILRGRRGNLLDLVQLVVVPRGSDGKLPALVSRGEPMPAEAGAQPNYVMTMAAVGKGIGGPEPIEGAFEAGPTAPVSGPLVAVIDTGIVAATRGDNWLNNVARTDDNVDRLDVLPQPDGFLDFQAGHGTFVAGVVQRVAPGADIRLYQAADTDGFATDAAIADAIQRAHQDGAKIINLSMGGLTVDDQPPPAMAETIKGIYAADDEMVFVAAAGNFGDDPSPCFPAALPQVIAVAGLTAELDGAEWSSHGDGVELSTVAEGIRSTFVTGCESPVFDREPEVFGPDAWALWTGTSFAAPQVAGGIWRLCNELGLAPRKAAEELARRGTPVPGYGQGMQILSGIYRTT